MKIRELKNLLRNFRNDKVSIESFTPFGKKLIIEYETYMDFLKDNNYDEENVDEFAGLILFSSGNLLIYIHY